MTAQISNPTFGINTVYLYGSLADQFGSVLKISGETIARVLRILEANFHGKFFKALTEGSFFVWTGDGNHVESPEGLGYGTSQTELHIMPHIVGSEGSANKGGLLALIGVVIVGAAIVFSGGTLAAPLAGLQGTIWGTVAQFGLGLALTGISQMLSPMPELDSGANEQQPSYVYGGPMNTEYEGGAIAVIYGSLMVGSVVVSGGIAVENLL